MAEIDRYWTQKGFDLQALLETLLGLERLLLFTFIHIPTTKENKQTKLKRNNNLMTQRTPIQSYY